MGLLSKKHSQEGSQHSPKKKGKIRRFFSAFGRCLAILIFMGIIAGSTAAALFSVYVFNSLEGEPDLRLEDITMNNTSTVYAIDSTTGEYKKIRELHGDQNRQEVKYNDIPQDIINCVVAAEDKRYWEHRGVDWIRTVASTLTFFTGSDTQGGSTITQQVIKNLTGNDAFSPERKVKEIFAALKLNKYYTKEQVLEVYLNYVFFGNNYYGIQAAANGYFGKDVDDLNIAEIATIIATTKNPTKYNPRTENGMKENAEVRRPYILNEMVKMGTLTQEECDYWVDYDVEVVKSRPEATVQLSDGWYIDQVIEDVVNDLVEEKGYTKPYAESYLKNSGLSIYACVDEEVQAKMEAVYADNASFPPVNNETYPETAAITIAPTGQVLGIIGGNEKTTARGWNNATMTVRHPGSSIKPISAYLQAFESDLVTWSSLWDDNPIPDYFGPDEPGPKNYDNVYRGAITIQYALQQSVNTVPVKLIQTVTPQRSYNFLRDKFQFENLSESDIALSPMALGGMTYGVTLRELTGAYQIFVSQGEYVKPYTYTKVTDRDGNIILERDTTQVRVISDQTATILNKLLQTVITRGTGAAGNLSSIGMPAGGKTGSSTGTKLVNGVLTPVDNDNLWFIGFTPYYITGVWMGYDDHTEIRYSSYPTPKLWKNIMLPLHEGLSPKQFEENEHVVQMTYCLESGEIATPNCTETAVGWYKDTVIPSNCTVHFSGYYDEDEPDDDEPNHSSNDDDWDD